MAQRQDEVVLELENTGERTDRIKSYRISSDYMQPTDSWEVVVYSDTDPRGLRRTWLPLQRVKLYINGHLQLFGRIDGTQGVGDSSASLRIWGRDYLSDLVDGGADPAIKVTSSMDLGTAVLEIVKHFGVTGLVGNWNLTRNLITGKRPFEGAAPRDFKSAKISEFQIRAGMGAYEVANKIAARHGFTLQPAHERHILAVTEPLFGQDASFSLSRPGNILRASAKRDWGDVPTVTVVTGRNAQSGSTAGSLRTEFPSFGPDAPSPLGRFDEIQRIIDPPGAPLPTIHQSRFRVKDEGVAENAGVLYRPLFFEDKDSKNADEVERAARRLIAERLKATLTYGVTLHGHSDPDTGFIYSNDTIGEVKDEIEDVNENLWILGRDVYNEGGGPMTELRMIRPGSIEL